MKIKTLLIASATLALGAINSQAQNVYSQNVVGYINIPLSQGYTLIANQLDTDGNGTNNNVATFFGTNLVAGSIVEAWQPGSASFTSANWINSKGVLKWTGDTNTISKALALGQGVFVYSPSTNNITEVGTVFQGTNVINTLIPGYNLVSAMPPISGAVQTNLNYTPSVGDLVETWSPVTATFTGYSFINSKGTLKWSPSQPSVPVGGAVFISTTNTAWTNTFSVQ